MRKAMIMPIFFGLIVIGAAAGYTVIFFIAPIPLIFKIIIAVAETALAVAMIYILIQRNREIKEEEHIDLSKY